MILGGFDSSSITSGMTSISGSGSVGILQLEAPLNQWTGGEIAGLDPSLSTLRISPGATLQVSSPQSAQLANFTLVNSGTLLISSGGDGPAVGDLTAVMLDNQRALDVLSGAVVFGSGSSSGTIRTAPGASLAIGSQLFGDQVRWDGGGDGSAWFDPQNWATNVLPSVYQQVVLDPTDLASAALQPVVGFAGSATEPMAQVAAIWLKPGFGLEIASGLLEVSGNVTVGGDLRVSGGLLDVGGDLAVDPSAEASLSITAGSSETTTGIRGRGQGTATLLGRYQQTGGSLEGFQGISVSDGVGDVALRGSPTGPARLSSTDWLVLGSESGALTLDRVELRAGSSIQLSAATGLSLASTAATAPGGLFALQVSGQDASAQVNASTLDLSTPAAPGGTIDLRADQITIADSAFHTSGLSTGGSIALQRFSSTGGSITLAGSQLMADPAAEGGQIQLLADGILVANGSLLNMVGSRGGSLLIGDSSTGSLQLQSSVTIQSGPNATLTYRYAPTATYSNAAAVQVIGGSSGGGGVSGGQSVPAPAPTPTPAQTPQSPAPAPVLDPVPAPSSEPVPVPEPAPVPVPKPNAPVSDATQRLGLIEDVLAALTQEPVLSQQGPATATPTAQVPSLATPNAQVLSQPALDASLDLSASFEFSAGTTTESGGPAAGAFGSGS